jgi:hypothetical protein
MNESKHDSLLCFTSFIHEFNFDTASLLSMCVLKICVSFNPKRLHINNVHELLNLGARKKELIEDNFNTEKNRGYRYKHAFSYDWNAMQGFHYLMRLGHAINALSEFTKKLKHYIKSLGCSATLKLIKETLFHPWLPTEWIDDQNHVTPQLRFQFE